MNKTVLKLHKQTKRVLINFSLFQVEANYLQNIIKEELDEMLNGRDDARQRPHIDGER